MTVRSRQRFPGRALCVACLLGLAPTGAAQGQESDLDRVRAHYGAETAVRVEEVVQGAERRGVPRAPMLDKALEAAAKEVPAERLMMALTSYRDRLVRSRSALGPDATARELTAGAAALRRGAPPGTLPRVAAVAPDDATIPLLVLGELVALGVTAEEAAGVVERTIRRSEGRWTLLSVPAGVRRVVAGGESPSAALGRVGDALRGGAPPNGVPGSGPGGM